MTTDKAGEARKGMLDVVFGKAKEVAGALTNKDDLVEEDPECCEGPARGAG